MRGGRVPKRPEGRTKAEALQREAPGRTGGSRRRGPGATLAEQKRERGALPELDNPGEGERVQQHVHTEPCVGAPWCPPALGRVGRGVTSTTGTERRVERSTLARTGTENVN